jgi:hypothetical protein
MFMAQQVQVTRVDPKPRAGAHMIGTISNKQPDRAYLLANPNDEMTGVSMMEAVGWLPLMAGKDKEKIVGGRPDAGGRLTVRGLVIMWRPLADQEEDLREKHAFAARHEVAKRQPGGIDNVVGVSGPAIEESKVRQISLEG